MTTRDVLNTKRDHILQLAAQHGAHNVRVFGSVARGEAGSTSDLDLLVQCTRAKLVGFHRPESGA